MSSYQILLEIHLVQSNVNMMDFYLFFNLVDLAGLFFLHAWGNSWDVFKTQNLQTPLFNSCLTLYNLQVLALQGRRFCKKFLSFSHLPDDHHFKFKDITKFYFIYILISAVLVLFSRSFIFFEVSYGLFSNCFDLVLTPNGEPCFEYFMAKNP